MIQEYQYVYEVYKERSFTKAAKNLFISQPSLSASIKKIETQLGYRIFDRSSSGLSLTQEGEYYIEAAEKILTAENDLQIYINDLTQLETGKLTISGTALFSSCVIPYIIKTFSELYPKITLNFLEADSQILYEEALKDQVDLIIDAGIFNAEQFSKEFLFYENILLAIPIHNPLIDIHGLKSIALSTEEICIDNHLSDNCPCIDLNLLRDETFVLLKSGHDLHQRAISFCEEAGFTPKCSIYLNQLMTIFHTAAKGLGCTFITDTLIKHSNTTAPLLYFKLNPADFSLSKREVFIAYRKNCHVTHAMKKCINASQKIRIFN